MINQERPSPRMPERLRPPSRTFVVACLLFYCLGVAGYFGWEYYHTRQSIFSTIDRSLFLVANSLKYILAPDFHDRASGPDSISFDEELKNRQLINRLAEETQFVYIYTLIEKDGAFYFAAPTVTPEEAVSQKRWYYHPYTDIPDEFVEAYHIDTARYATYNDQWGSFRSIALPQLSAGGRRYLACADMDISHVRQMLRDNFIFSLLQALYFFLLSTPFLLIFMLNNRVLQKANSRLTTQKSQLEKLADERLQSQQELIVARDEAEKASIEKSNFLANMSHEIRTPMNIITGMNYLALDSGLNDTQRGYLENINNATTLLLRIIDDILDFSKIEAGRLKLEQFSFRIAEAVNEVEAMNRIMADAKDIEFSCQVADDADVIVLGDEDRLKQVLINLVGNAIKFTDHGSVSLTVTASEQSATSVQLVFSIRDTGIGIDEVALNKLFQPFSQADGSRTRKYGGTGLGLVICKKLTELMGGSIEVTSVPNQGSRFDLLIPFIKTTEQHRPEHRATPLKFNADSVAMKSVLVVDDHALNRDLIKVLLDQAGFKITLAENGRQAIELVEKNRYDLILMDIQMPVLDGLEATRSIRLRDNRVPIVAMTSHALSGDSEKSFEAGMNGHLTKPIDMHALHEILVTWIPDLQTVKP